TAATRISTLTLHDALPIFRLQFPPDRGGEDDAVGGDNSTQAEDQQLPADNDRGEPGRGPVDVDERDQRPGDEQLVGGRVEERARSEEHTSELQSPYDLVCR